MAEQTELVKKRSYDFMRPLSLPHYVREQRKNVSQKVTRKDAESKDYKLQVEDGIPASLYGIDVEAANKTGLVGRDKEKSNKFAEEMAQETPAASTIGQKRKENKDMSRNKSKITHPAGMPASFAQLSYAEPIPAPWRRGYNPEERPRRQQEHEAQEKLNVDNRQLSVQTIALPGAHRIRGMGWNGIDDDDNVTHLPGTQIELPQNDNKTHLPDTQISQNEIKDELEIELPQIPKLDDLGDDSKVQTLSFARTLR